MKKLAAVLAAAALVSPAFADDGADLWATKCKSCHGVDGTPSPVGEKMGAKALKGLKLDAAALEKVIAEGKPNTKMMAFKDKLSAVQIKAVAAHTAKLLK